MFCQTATAAASQGPHAGKMPRTREANGHVWLEEAKLGRGHEFPRETDAGVLIWHSQSSSSGWCVLVQSSGGPQELSRFTEHSPVHLALEVSLIGDSGGLIRTGKSLDPEFPCVAQPWGTLNSPSLKNPSHSQGQKPTGPRVPES